MFSSGWKSFTGSINWQHSFKSHAQAVVFVHAGFGSCRNHAALAPGSPPHDSNFSRKFAGRLTSFSARDVVTGGTFPLFKIGVSIMRVDHPQLNKRDRRAEPSFWVEEPTDDALSLLENALRGDEPALRREERADEANALIEENARLRELLSQLSDLIRKNGIQR
ncbi:hypothetical protein [Bradyrhizobium sp. CCBAU 051011]|uniref:hypothetical protein n=1 Tax=Bradyrhizobium sp. CCBAU 051011 TaxID=858422 RepID=UPI00137A7628|nr:hypothetical protein [Bradyrhizobium sp. CCBAU 051011]